MAFVVVILFQDPAEAIVFRHDRDEKLFLDLGRQYPATAKIRRVGTKKISGAEGILIAPRWILTAAHVSKLLAQGGEVELRNKTYTADKVVTHPEWDGETPRSSGTSLSSDCHSR